MKTEATSPVVPRTDYASRSQVTTSPAFGSAAGYRGRPSTAAAVLPLLLAFTTSLTSGVTYMSESPTPARYFSSSTLSPFRRRRSQQVSLMEARQIALQILRQANQDLRQEREAEARFILRFWDEQND